MRMLVGMSLHSLIFFENLTNQLSYSLGTLIQPSPSISCFLSQTLALLQLVMSLLTTSITTCFGLAPSSQLFSQCLHLFMP